MLRFASILLLGLALSSCGGDEAEVTGCETVEYDGCEYWISECAPDADVANPDPTMPTGFCSGIVVVGDERCNITLDVSCANACVESATVVDECP